MSISVDVQKTKSSQQMAQYDVIVIGAGPYGLSTAAHLRGRGLNVGIFGKPLQLWKDYMPEGMFLRSYWWASNLSDPEKKYGLAQYFEAHQQEAPDPLPIETFIDYGLWFQRHAVPMVDETFVDSVEKEGQGFKLTLVDGRIVRSPSVVMAPGMHYFAYRPSEYDELSPDLVSHASEYGNVKRLAGKRVAVVGGGQSALELSALLYEHGAEVSIVSRRSIRWLVEESIGQRSLWQQIRFPKAGIAPGWFNWGLENLPYAFQMLPRDMKEKLARGRGSYGPAGSAWLKPRLVGKVAFFEGTTVQELDENGGQVLLKLANGDRLEVDHLVLATGYRVDIRRLPMLHESLLPKIRTSRHAPILNQRFESTVPGLHFVGLSSVSSFGPFYRFVVGTDATAKRVASAVARQTVRVK